MEKCFQRQLLEYEEFVGAVGTPTVICRRTGEVASVGKEFCLLTGWEKEVLLGVRKNGNENLGRRGGETEGASTGTSSRAGGLVTATTSGAGAGTGTGAITPRNPTAAVDTSAATFLAAGKDQDKPKDDDKDKEKSTPTPRQQPVFLAELLDDDSVVRFYEDFAKLAFADSKGSAWRPCKLLKYRTREEVLRRGLGREKRREQNVEQKNGEKEKEKEKDDEVVDCMYCWTVKRDVFDIPMMIVINFLPLV